MIDVIAGTDLRKLAEAVGERCVSIYFPTHRAGEERAQDPIRLKNAAKLAGRELEALGLKRSAAEELLSPIAALEADARFWDHVELGLALFVNGDVEALYRLPQPVEELVVVADRFHLKPLLPLVATGEIFYVLVLGENEIRLLRGSRTGIADVALGDIPQSLAEALPFDDREAQLHLHGAGRVGGGSVTATFHGHGVGKDTRAVDRERFFALVDRGVCGLLANSPAPVVLAGVADTVARYRQLSKYPHLCQAAIEGSVEKASPAVLHERAWAMAEPYFDDGRRNARQAIEVGGAASADNAADALVDVLRAASLGQVASLFVPADVQKWGRFEAGGEHIEAHPQREPGDRDLIDAAAVETLAHGGDVFVVDAEDVPGWGVVAAELRY